MLSTDASEDKMFRVVRSLSRWTLTTSLVLISYLVVVVLQVLWSLKEDRDASGELDHAFALALAGGALLFSMLFAVPAWFAMAASQTAGNAVASRNLRPLASSAKWVRRFLIAAGISLSLYALVAATALALYLARLNRV